jgi:cytochrome c oxidase subunit 2
MRWFLPIAAAAHADAIDRITTLVHLLMLVLFAGWTIYFVWVLVRFRRARQPKAEPAGARGRLAFWTEVGVVAAEAVLLVVFALPLWYDRMAAQPSGQNAVVIRVIAEQFAWNVHYPGQDGRFGDTTMSLISPTNPIGLNRTASGSDDVVDLGRIHVPVNRQVLIQLSSKDVIHSFGVPAMRIKRDAVPGLVAPIWFTPTVPGEYEIACSQLCGLAHFRMRGTIVVESETAFRAFLTAEAAAGR